MPHDPRRSDETRAWFLKAAQDLRAGNVALTATPPITGDAVFHAQQAAEKSLKALLTWHDRPFRKTHDLTELGQQYVDIEPALEPLLKRGARLSVYAWVFRYPGDVDEPPIHEAREALELAREIHERLRSRVPREAQP
jgi:HEPN domain-containing protein